MGEPAQEGTMSAKKATEKSAKTSTATSESSGGFSEQERAAMKDRADEARIGALVKKAVD
jgi:hypothetical protein